MKILDTGSKDFDKNFSLLENRFDAGTSGKKITATVETIISDIQKNGDKALFEYTKKFDRVSLTPATVKISTSKMKSAGKTLPPKLKAAIKTSFNNVKIFHKRQVEKSWMMKTGRSSKIGQKISPMERVGLYVPGGTAAYPSSVIMNAIPALVAGVKEIVICSPPSPDGKINPAVLYAASLCGIKEFYTIGGAQAVAALAYGTKTIKKVDKITGPGNAYVAEAKRQVFGQVDIDMVAGPSEICVIADDSADPAWVAADLLSQAEHDALSWTLLISTSGKLIKSVAIEVEKQAGELARKEIAKKSLADRSYAVKVKSIAEAVEIANRFASEHLELYCKGASKLTDKIKHAGAIFVGGHSPEALGDYMAGPNHILPTAGSARFFSPLGVYDFVKRSSVIEYSRDDFAKIAEQVALFASSEGLEGHALSAKMRIPKKGSGKK